MVNVPRGEGAWGEIPGLFQNLTKGKFVKLLSAFILLVAIMSHAGGNCFSSWTPVGNPYSSATTLSAGAWNSPSTSQAFTVDVHTQGSTDTASFYLADANGVAQSDVVTVIGGASSYALAGGVKRFWRLSGPWSLVLTKAVGVITADVCQ